MILLLIYYMAKLVRAEKELSYWFPERSEFSYTDRSRKDLTKSRERVFHQDIQTPRSGLKNEAQPIFLTDFEVFGCLMKHSFEFMIWLLKPFIIPGEIQSKSSQTFMLITIRYPNHRHGSDFFCFLLMNY